jgi:protein O-mannosyl-transferase
MVKPALSFSWNRDLVWGLLLAAATFLVYQPAWNGQPVWDDDVHMTPPELRSMNGLAKIWMLPRGPVQYFPLVQTVFWVEARLFGDSTSGYHLLNILLHVLSALLLVVILRKLGIRGAWLAGGIFALHPVMVESVAWISELKNTLSGVFFLSAALAYLNYTEAGKRRSYLLSLGLFILGLMSKTTIAPFPLAMLAVVWWKHGRVLWRRDIMPLFPFFIGGILLGLITLYVERAHGTRTPEFDFSFIERCLIAGRALCFYLGKVLLPVNLIISYPRWDLSTAVWWQYLFPAAALIAGCILWAMRKVSRAPAAVLFYFAAMLLPYLGFISFYTFRYSFAADHYQYLAAIGPIVIGAGLVDKAVGSERGNGRVLKPVVTVMLLLTLGMLSWNQSRMYTDAETLYRTTISRNSKSWMAHTNLGVLLVNHGRTEEAIAHYRKALELNPDYADVHNNLAILLVERGRIDEAMAHYRKALKLDPDHTKAYNNIGVLLKGMGRTDEAMAYFQKVVEIDPEDGDVYYNIGGLLEDMGRTDEALVQYRKSLGLNPNHVETLYNLGLLLTRMGRIDEAIVHYRKVVELNPGHADAHNNLGILLADIGQIDEAIVHFSKALDVNPHAIGACKNLAVALAQKGRLTDAVPVFRRAIALATSAGDEARAKAIAQILSKLNESINPSQVNSTMRAQR